jgi:NAD(P)-dependent dehydrogenase (short-subunit alcohol dehydrogenase family)
MEGNPEDMEMAVDPVGLFDLRGRVAIVTGASGGLGSRFARLLAAAGAEVIAAARRTDRVEALAAADERIAAVSLDVTDAESRARLFELVDDRHGRIDLLVNNAGLCRTEPAELGSVESFEEVVDVNLTSLFAMAQLAGRRMLEQGGGSIVNIASMYGLVAPGRLQQASYAASKGGVVNLTRQLSAEWVRRGVRVNAIAPGFFPSEMTIDLFESERSLTWLRRNAPIGRPGAPDELDGALLLLASDAGSYISGQTLAVDGGWTSV